MSKVRNLLFLVLISAFVVSCSSDKSKDPNKETKNSAVKKQKLTKLDKDKEELTKLLEQQVKRIDKSLSTISDTTSTVNRALKDSLEVKKAALVEKTAQVNAATKETWKAIKKDATQTLSKAKKEIKVLLAPTAATKE